MQSPPSGTAISGAARVRVPVFLYLHVDAAVQTGFTVAAAAAGNDDYGRARRRDYDEWQVHSGIAQWGAVYGIQYMPCIAARRGRLCGNR